MCLGSNRHFVKVENIKGRALVYTKCAAEVGIIFSRK